MSDYNDAFRPQHMDEPKERRVQLCSKDQYDAKQIKNDLKRLIEADKVFSQCKAEMYQKYGNQPNLQDLIRVMKDKFVEAELGLS